jgi:hypothetical protein
MNAQAGWQVITTVLAGSGPDGLHAVYTCTRLRNCHLLCETVSCLKHSVNDIFLRLSRWKNSGKSALCGGTPSAALHMQTLSC